MSSALAQSPTRRYAVRSSAAERATTNSRNSSSTVGWALTSRPPHGVRLGALYRADRRSASGIRRSLIGRTAESRLHCLRLVHLLDHPQIELVRVRQVLDLAQRLLLTGRLKHERAVVEQPAERRL